MYYDIKTQEFTIYNDGRKARFTDVENVASFKSMKECYAYLDGIQEWNEDDVKVSIYRTKKSYLMITYWTKWGTTNITYTIKKR